MIAPRPVLLRELSPPLASMNNQLMLKELKCALCSNILLQPLELQCGALVCVKCLQERIAAADSISGRRRTPDSGRESRKLLAKVVFQVEKGTKQVTCQLDTAASCNVMTKMDYEKLGKPKLKKSRTCLIMYDGSINESLSQCRVLVVNRDGK